MFFLPPFPLSHRERSRITSGQRPFERVPLVNALSFPPSEKRPACLKAQEGDLSARLAWPRLGPSLGVGSAPGGQERLRGFLGQPVSHTRQDVGGLGSLCAPTEVAIKSRLLSWSPENLI